MLGRANASPGRLQALARLTAWTRAHFALPGDAVVSVSELRCSVPGCPPRETVVMFWTAAGGRRCQFKVFKPLEEVAEDDVPPGWLRDSLAVCEEYDCGCC